MATSHLVVPGQVVARSSNNSEDDDGFLRGHGTYVEKLADEQRLVASVCGIVERVNKLVTVVPVASRIYHGHVGDLVVGRVVAVGPTRWRVSLATGRDAALPLSGVHLPGGVQRVRTAQDQRDMRQFLAEGDLISAEVHKVQPSDGSLSLHTRSYRYGKLENGCLVTVPPALIPRRKNHYLQNVVNQLDVLWGVNGNIWIQRKLPQYYKEDDFKDMAELQETLRTQHAETPTEEERPAIARLRNAIECLKLVHSMVTPERAEAIYKLSEQLNLRPAEMLLPQNVLHLTLECRQQQPQS